MRLKKALSVLICLMLIMSLLPAQVLGADEPVTVTIFTTNDIHGAVEGGDTSIGLAQAAAIKASTPNALLVDAGDATQGSTFATVSQGEDVIRIMSAAGYDAMAAGNHDFDYGTAQLLLNAEAADFPILSANVTLNGEELLPGSVIVEAGGKSIGFIGLTTISTATSTNPSKLTGVEFGDEIAAAKEQLAAIADDADAVVIICHMGDNAAAVDCTSSDLLDALSDEELNEIAAVVDGHSHTLEETVYTRDGASIPVVQTGTLLTALGMIELTFDGEAVTVSGSVLDYDAAMAYTLTDDGQAAAGSVQSAIDEANAKQAGSLNEILCTNDLPLWGGYIYWDYAESRISETNYGDLITDAFASSAGVFAEQNGISLPVVALENGGGISATLPIGKVTRGDVLSAFNHGNMVEVLEITPAQLYAALEAGLEPITGQDDTGLLLRERVSGSFMQISGFTYSYDPAAESGAKVVSVMLDNGTELIRADDQTKLLLSTNSYVASSFSAAGAEKLGELGGEDQIVMEYILSQTEKGGSLSYTNIKNRIRIASDSSPASYTVTIPLISAYDNETSVPGTRIVHLSVDGGQSSIYITNSNGTISVKLDSGPHTLCLDESSDGQPVYVNNYSGSGTVTTKAGYYRFGFPVYMTGITAPSGSGSFAGSGNSAAASPDTSVSFSDVSPDSWYYDAVKYAVEHGMMNGTGKNAFSPASTTTRGMIVTILYRLEGEPAVTGFGFTDVDKGAYYGNAVAWASKNGIVEGYGNGTFGPNDIITREQLATILWRYAGQPKAAAGLAAWPDAASVGEYAETAVAWAVERGIIVGIGGSLVPKGDADRAQAATILMRYCEAN